MVRRDDDDHDCAWALTLIDERLDGPLSDPPAAELVAHIEQCEACRNELKLGEAIQRELSRLPQFDTPPRVLDSALRRIDERMGAGESLRWRDRPRPAWVALAAAALAALALTVILVMPGRLHQPDRPSRAEVARATAEAQLAFALIADATRRAEHELRDSVLRDRVLATAVRSVSRSFLLRSRLGRSEGPDPTPTIQSGGST